MRNNGGSYEEVRGKRVGLGHSLTTCHEAKTHIHIVVTLSMQPWKYSASYIYFVAMYAIPVRYRVMTKIYNKTTKKLAKPDFQYILALVLIAVKRASQGLQLHFPV